MAVSMKRKNKKNINNNGQALFEFIFFLPIMSAFLFLLFSVGNSINGSINQQKISRSYFYARIKNNSMMPLVGSIEEQRANLQFNSMGMFYIGWKERFNSSSSSENGIPLAPCYKMHVPLKNFEQECSDYNQDEINYIRVGTVYGACGATFVNIDSEMLRAPVSGNINIVSDMNGCLIR